MPFLIILIASTMWGIVSDFLIPYLFDFNFKTIIFALFLKFFYRITSIRRINHGCLSVPMKTGNPNEFSKPTCTGRFVKSLCWDELTLSLGYFYPVTREVVKSGDFQAATDDQDFYVSRSCFDSLYITFWHRLHGRWICRYHPPTTLEIRLQVQ